MNHVHNWIIDPPRGKTSTGRCKCGAEQEFYNSAEGASAFRRTFNNGHGMLKRHFDIEQKTSKEKHNANRNR